MERDRLLAYSLFDCAFKNVAYIFFASCCLLSPQEGTKNLQPKDYNEGKPFFQPHVLFFLLLLQAITCYIITLCFSYTKYLHQQILMKYVIFCQCLDKPFNKLINSLFSTLPFVWILILTTSYLCLVLSPQQFQIFFNRIVISNFFVITK